MLRLNDFKPVRLDDQSLFQAQYQRYPQVHSDNTFANMVCWNHYADYRFAHKSDSILLSSTINGKTTFRAPIGPHDPELLYDLIDLALREGDETAMLVMDPASKEWISEVCPGLPLQSDQNFSDYIYRTADLADLPGGTYTAIRRQVNRFSRDYPSAAEEVGSENIDEVREFLILWCEWKDCDSVPILSYEKDAILFAMDHFFDLSLLGWIIRVNGTIGALSVVGRLNDDTAVVHFEKALPDTYRGIYKVINVATAAGLVGRYEYINRECDMGVAGLRESKMRYHPHHMAEVYFATREDLQVYRP
jgi:uncharacterized protein